MTRIKKRRSGKKKTSDAQRFAAGRKRARVAEKPGATAPKDPDATGSVAAAKKTSPPKKRFEPVKGGRRGGRAAGKNTTAFKEPRATGESPAKKTTPVKNAAAGKSTGKTRSAGARRVAVSRSVANTFKKKEGNKKSTAPQKKGATPKKQSKGFAPWAKNKFKKKHGGE